MVNIPSFTGFYTSQVVQDFFHQKVWIWESSQTSVLRHAIRKKSCPATFRALSPLNLSCRQCGIVGSGSPSIPSHDLASSGPNLPEFWKMQTGQGCQGNHIFPQDKETTKQPSINTKSLELKETFLKKLSPSCQGKHTFHRCLICFKKGFRHTPITRLVKRSSIGSAPSIANMSLAHPQTLVNPKIFSFPQIFPPKKNSPLGFLGFFPSWRERFWLQKLNGQTQLSKCEKWIRKLLCSN